MEPDHPRSTVFPSIHRMRLQKKAIFGFRTRDERRHLQNPLLFDSGRRCGRCRARVCVCPARFNAVEVDFSQVFDEPLSSLKQVEIQRLRSAVV